MSKLVFPGVGAPYRGFIGEARGWFRAIASYLEKQPGAATALNSQIAVLADATGYVQALPATSAIVTDGQTLDVDTGTVTLTVADGVVTAAYAAAE